VVKLSHKVNKRILPDVLVGDPNDMANKFSDRVLESGNGANNFGKRVNLKQVLHFLIKLFLLIEAFCFTTCFVRKAE
jgi:hypothetical protein